MGDTKRAAVEEDIRGRHARGDVTGAAEAAMRGYGQEIWSFLVALHRRDEDGASEAFSLFAEGVLRGLPGFAWQSSFRTWAYAVARNCSLRVRRDTRRRAARRATLPEGSALSQLVDQIRRDTAPSTVARRRSRLLALREILPPDDQTLLMLRLDRELAWNELAQVLADEGAPLEGPALKREAARLRQRYQTIKEKLYEAAEREGMIARRAASD